MTNIIGLTSRANGERIFVNADHIVSYYRNGEYTAIVVSTGFGTIDVTEGIYEITEMIEQPEDFTVHRTLNRKVKEGAHYTADEQCWATGCDNPLGTTAAAVEGDDLTTYICRRCADTRGVAAVR